MGMSMAKPCSSCGEHYGYSIVARGDFERSFDYAAEWQGLRLLCPGCGALQRVSFASLTLTNQPLPGVDADTLRVHAVVGSGPEVVPFPQAKRVARGGRGAAG